jgi:hypothetical protein
MTNQKIETNVVKPETYFVEGDLNFTIIPQESESLMDRSIEDLTEFLKSNHGDNLTEDQKDELYVKAQTFVRDIKKCLRDTKFNFFLTRRQYDFLTTLILQKMEYNVDTIFVALELRSLMVSLKDIDFKDDKELKSCTLDPTELTYLYHLISTHKVRGLQSEAFNFANVLRRIGEISKLINYYNGSAENLQTDINNWVLNMGFSDENQPQVEEVQ